MNRPPRVIVGAKLPLRPMRVWAIRMRLQIGRRLRDLARFDTAPDSKLRGCDAVCLRFPDVEKAFDRAPFGGDCAPQKCGTGLSGTTSFQPH